MVGRRSLVGPPVTASTVDTGNNDGPPPSTYAARLVHDHAQVIRKHDADQASSFTSLIREILHGQDPPEINPETNYKVIELVMTVGVDALLLENPFSKADKLASQAKDCLSVIESTLRRQPQLLFYSASHGPEGSGGPPMIIWLFVRLLRVCISEKISSVWSEVRSLLTAILEVLCPALDFWHHPASIRRLYQETIEDALASLHAHQRVPTNVARPFDVTLPPARSLSHLSADQLDTIIVSSGAQLRLRTPMKVLDVSIMLFEAIVKSSQFLPDGGTLARWSGDVADSIVVNLLRQRDSLDKHGFFTRYALRTLDMLGVMLEDPKWHCSACIEIACSGAMKLLHAHSRNPLADETQSSLAELFARLTSIRSPRDSQIQVPGAAICLAANDQLVDELSGRLLSAVRSYRASCLSDVDAPVTNGDVDMADEPLADRGEGHDPIRRPNHSTNPVKSASVPPPVKQVFDGICELVYSTDSRSNKDVLGMITPSSYRALRANRQESLWSALAMIPCAMTDSLRPGSCSLCSDDSRLKRADEAAAWNEDDALRDTLFETLVMLIKLPELDQSVRFRCLAAVAARSFLLHVTDSQYLALEDSHLGQWCLRNLSSSSRDLRFLCSDMLIAFLRNGLSSDLRDANRRCALLFLRRLSEHPDAGRDETLIRLWGQIILVCGDREQNLALLQLVGYLGHNSTYTCAVARYEIEQVALLFDCSTEMLLKPFWRSVAPSVVSDLLIKPQKVQLLTEIIDMDVTKFLKTTQIHTVPYLVLSKKIDVLQRIASASGSNVSPADLILTSKPNLAAVLALLFLQVQHDPEAFVAAVLSEVVPGITTQGLYHLVNTDPVPTMVELLKAAGDEQDSSREKTSHRAINDFIGVCISRQSSAQRGKSRSLRSVTDFLDLHILGIMASFSNSIESSSGGFEKKSSATDTQEKVRCLRGIEELTLLAKSILTTAIPQIRACLQSAIDSGELLNPAVSAWLSLMQELDGDDVVLLLEHLLTIIVQNWTELDSVIQERCHETIGMLLKNHNQLIREQIIMIPSLASVPLLSKFAEEIKRLKAGATPQALLEAYNKRLQDENACVVLQAVRELEEWLRANQGFVQDGSLSDPPLPVVAGIVRTLLDVCVKYNSDKLQIADTAARCLGVIGCLDSNRLEVNVSDNQVILLSDFGNAREANAWIIRLFIEVLIPAFESAANARAQGFLAYAMQALIKFAGFENSESNRLRSSQVNPANEAWATVPQHAKNTLMPFFTSHYVVTSNIDYKAPSYPLFKPGIAHADWLKKWIYDMLWRGKGDNAKEIFSILLRVILRHDIAIARFLLPYVTLNIVLGGDVKEVQQIAKEMLIVLSTDSTEPAELETLKQSSEDVFSILDYMTRWVQEKKQNMTSSRIMLLRAGHPVDELEEATNIGRIQSVENIVSSIPANIIAQRAIQCGSYARALFHWENFIREQKQKSGSDIPNKDQVFARLQSIYSQIDEPDGLDGIAAQMSLLSPEQEAYQHLRAERYTAAQSWYEIELASDSDSVDLQTGLLTCLQRSGQHNQVISVTRDLLSTQDADKAKLSWRRQVLSYTAEAAWSIGVIGKYMTEFKEVEDVSTPSNFNVSLAMILQNIEDGDLTASSSHIQALRSAITKSLSAANVSSLSACHGQMLQLHILYEMDQLKTMRQAQTTAEDFAQITPVLDKRLAVLGASSADKQMILSVRRAAIKASGMPLQAELGNMWLTTAILARKSDNTTTAHTAVLAAAKCGVSTARIEQARLMWRAGLHRQAMQAIEGALSSRMFAGDAQVGTNGGTAMTDGNANWNPPLSRARLLLAKWIDASGQSQVEVVRDKYQEATKEFRHWDKGFYYLAKHYNKVLEAEKAAPSAKRQFRYQSGEMTKVTIENYLRSLPFGTKYWHQTIPKLLTLWLDMGMDCVTKAKDVSPELFEARKAILASTNSQIRKYFDRTASYAFYTALSQMLSRISHPNIKVAEHLCLFITKIVATYPAQSLWTLLPVTRASAQDRALRCKEIVTKLREYKSKRTDVVAELKSMVIQGQRLQDSLLLACDMHIEGRSSSASLARDLNFNHKYAPNPLVIPFQHLLTPSIPLVHSAQEAHRIKPFAQDKVTIASFSDDVLVLNSLQRPRKLTIRGSDGKSYGLLCKPKDDLRKDQRLMEFNTMINRALKRDQDTSKRRLYIKTYAVTPLSEESGAIEWVEGIKPIRDILLSLYKRRGISPNYNDIRHLLNEASSHPSNYNLFTSRLLPQFPPVLHEYFTDTFSSPSSWFTSRLRYTRTHAVMSMVGHVLGLGDRHGENILLEESSGGIFHVDFNCLFDKGLTFEKPELVPFRLTHNMVDAMGPEHTGLEGPFRRCAELVLRCARTEHDTLMNVLETFLHDPTADFIGHQAGAGAAKKQRKAAGANNNAAKDAAPDVARSSVPETPQEVLDSVSGKVRGFLAGQSVPLGVEGHVQALIGMATDEGNLCRMYIGWCAFF